MNYEPRGGVVDHRLLSLSLPPSLSLSSTSSPHHEIIIKEVHFNHFSLVIIWSVAD